MTTKQNSRSISVDDDENTVVVEDCPDVFPALDSPNTKVSISTMTQPNTREKEAVEQLAKLEEENEKLKYELEKYKSSFVEMKTNIIAQEQIRKIQ